MKLLITGGTGHIGQKLIPLLINQGHDITCLTRNKLNHKTPVNYRFLEYNLTENEVPSAVISEFDGLIHLMGESIDTKWNQKAKIKIFESRVKSSNNLVNSILKSPQNRLKFLISTSAQGIYSDQGDRLLVEADDQLTLANNDFLVDVCRKWEDPFRRLEPRIRTVQLRLPMVLDPQFGALKKLISVFKKHLGAPLGNGQQWTSWVSSDDVIRLIDFVITHERVRGPLNAASPEPLRNAEFTKILARRLKVNTLPAVPKFMLKLIFGEMSSMILASARMSSAQALNYGFDFADSKLASYLQRLKNI